MPRFLLSLCAYVLMPAFVTAGHGSSRSFGLIASTGSAPAGVSLNVIPYAPVAGLPLTLTAFVTPSVAGTAATGTVTFSGGGLNLATVPLNTYGLARFSTTVLSPGAYTFIATYSGDATYAGAASPGANVTLKEPLNFPGDPLANYPSFTGAAASVHDPTIIRSGSKYYVLSTDQGYPLTSNLQIRCSSDLVNWSNCGHVFSEVPSWVTQAVPGVGGLWAPEIVFMNGRYFVYYSGSTFGSNQSVIGVATNTTLDPNDPAYAWVDQGEVIGSVHTDNLNAIDPSVMLDSDGTAWMSFGSYWSGINAVRIDPSTGLRSGTDNHIYWLASRPLTQYDPIEGSSLRKHGSYYYLFVSVDSCCQGANSTYRTLVGRSTSPTGPFTDEFGVPMLQGGGTQILGADAQWAGPGGGTVLIDPDGGDLIAYHAYHVPDGTPWLHVNSIEWVNNWPVVLSIPGIELTSIPAAPSVRQTVTFNLSLIGSGAPYPIPSGQVALFDGDSLLATQTVTSRATATFTTAGLSVGEHRITAHYLGANVYGKTVSAADTVSVGNPGVVTVDRDTYHFGRDLIGHALTDTVLTISNYKSVALTLNPAVTGEPAFTFASACGNTIPANSVCAVQVTFKPASTGTHEALLNLNLTGAGTTPQAITLYGTGITTPGLFVSGKRYDFGSDILDNQVTRKVVQIRNLQASPASFTPTITEDRAFALASSCNNQIPAYGTCDIEVTFSPATAGQHAAFLDFQWLGAPTETLNHVALTGTGASAPRVILSAHTYDFGPDLINNYLDRAVVQISNDELTPLSISPALSGGAAFQLLSSCGGEVAPFSICRIHVAFTPMLEGAQTATLHLNMAAASPGVTLPSGDVQLTGAGTSTQSVQVSASSYSFGMDVIGRPLVRQVVRIDNLQVAPLSLNPAIAGDPAFTLTNSCGNQIAAYRSCWIRVTFNPATAGAKTGSLAFNFASAPASTTSQITLGGTGTLPASNSTYTNPLALNDPATGPVISCPDPAIYKAQANGHNTWYLYCTGDPHNDEDVDQFGNLRFHFLSVYRSFDLVNWTYLNDPLPARPAWMDPNAGVWAAAIRYFNNQYYLYYTASNTVAGGSAIGVATSNTPFGPFIDKGSPIIPPQNNGFRWVFDPEITEDDSGQKYIIFGSYVGGISIRTLSPDGLTADPVSEQPITIDNRYEGGSIVKRNGYYYLFASAGNCCGGNLTGYSAWVGRSTTPTGPYLDQQGLPLLDSRPGGTPVLTMNGNQFVGPGGSVVFTDEAGQDYILYHAVDSTNGNFPGVGTARPALLDALDWINGWPVARGGYGPSDAAEPQPIPAAQPGETNRYQTQIKPQDQPAALLPAYSDEFNRLTLSPQWSFLHLTPASWSLTGTQYQVATVDPDLTNGAPQVPLLAENAPTGNYMVEAKVSINFPVSGCCYNNPQAALVIYGDDQHFLKADVFGLWDTRQVEFDKFISPVAPGFPNFGATPLSAARDYTWLRIVKRTVNGEDLYTPYSSVDGTNWVRGGTWIYNFGSPTKIGLAASTGSGWIVDVDYVRAYLLQ